MEIVNSEQMRSIDRYAIETLGIPGSTLMENAGRAVASAWLQDEPRLDESETESPSPWILCGKGNNGGDGLVVARLLQEAGGSPTVLLFADAASLPEDAAHHLAKARDAGVEVVEIPDEVTWKDRAKAFDSDTVVLDGLLGTGLKDAVRGLLRTVIDDLNRIGPAMTSIDLPSGLDADSASVPGVALRVDRAYMLCRPKLCRYLRPAMTFATNWSLLPIGIPDEAVASVACRLRVNDPQSLPLRPTDSHKGVHGHLLLVAGSVGKSGAAVLAGRGALRGGVGLVTVACPEAVRPEIACQQAELMTLGLNAADRETLEQRAMGFDAVALGPGLGLDDETVAWVRSLTGRLREPMVIDADGVNALARGGADPAWVATRPQAGTVLTPHPGEAARLLGWTTQQVQSDRLQALERLVEGWKVVVVLKGEHTLIGSPEGDVAVNITGNAGMATAGTGDVLTGLLGAFLARGIAPYEAACLAVQIHGDAGDRAAELLGQDGMIASDLVEMLPTSIQMRAES